MNRKVLWVIVTVYGLIAAGLLVTGIYRLRVGDKGPAAALAAGALYAVFRGLMVLQRAKKGPPA